jgi:hypothetical protein
VLDHGWPAVRLDKQEPSTSAVPGSPVGADAGSAVGVLVLLLAVGLMRVRVAVRLPVVEVLVLVLVFHVGVHVLGVHVVMCHVLVTVLVGVRSVVRVLLGHDDLPVVAGLDFSEWFSPVGFARASGRQMLDVPQHLVQ